MTLLPVRSAWLAPVSCKPPQYSASVMPISSAHKGIPELFGASAAFVDTEAAPDRSGEPEAGRVVEAEAGKVAKAEAGREDEAAAAAALKPAAAVRLVLVSPILSCSDTISL